MSRVLFLFAFPLLGCSDDSSGPGSAAGAAGAGASAGTSGGGSSANAGSASAGAAGASTAGFGAGGTGNPADPFDAERTACVDEINDYRATLGLAPYVRWTAQETCTDDQAARDANDGPHANFGDCNENAQNSCPRYQSLASIASNCLPQMWAEGPPPSLPCDGQCFQDHGHYMNMSSADFTRVACGFAELSGGDVWANQNFK